MGFRPAGGGERMCRLTVITDLLLAVCQNATERCCIMTGYLLREITPRLVRAQRQMPVIVISGLRQAGKSTLLQNEPALARKHACRTLDDFATLDERLFAIPLGHLLA